jgi:hypothetical protein
VGRGTRYAWTTGKTKPNKSSKVQDIKSATIWWVMVGSPFSTHVRATAMTHQEQYVVKGAEDLIACKPKVASNRGSLSQEQGTYGKVS